MKRRRAHAGVLPEPHDRSDLHHVQPIGADLWLRILQVRAVRVAGSRDGGQ